MSSETITFGRNHTALWTVPAITITSDLVCPNGMLARLSTQKPSEVAEKLAGLVTGDVVVFVRTDMHALPGVISLGISGGTHLLFLNFDVKNTNIVIHDSCYKDFYKKGATSSKLVQVFSKDIAGNYVYDRDTASFIWFDSLIPELALRQRYSIQTIETPYQNISENFEAYVETADIVFADFAVMDKAIDIYINALISVAGLKLTWASSTNVVFNEYSNRIKLGETELTGSFENETIRYEGKRFLKSIKLSPASRAAESIRYKIYADFINNGYDDIEINDINILTEMIFAEVAGNTDG